MLLFVKFYFLNIINACNSLAFMKIECNDRRNSVSIVLGPLRDMGKTLSTMEGRYHRCGGCGDATDKRTKHATGFLGRRADNFVER